MIDNYDYRAKGYVGGRGRAAEWRELPFGDPRKAILPQWRILRRTSRPLDCLVFANIASDTAGSEVQLMSEV